MQVQKTVFISYRRTNIYMARAVYANLRANGYDAFLDYQSLDSGDFSQSLLNQIAARAHFVVILTPSALERCTSPDDWMRKEIEYAIQQKRNVIPLMFEGFDFKVVNHFLVSDWLKMLPSYNGLRIPDDFFEEAMVRLCSNRYLDRALETVLHPVEAQAAKAAEAAQIKADAAPAPTSEQLEAERLFESGFYRNGLMGDFEGAIEDFTKAIALKSDFAEAYYRRGNSRWNKGDKIGALQDWKITEHLIPNDNRINIIRSAIAQEENNLNLALREAELGVSLNPFYDESYIRRSYVRHALNDLDGTIFDCNEALRVNPLSANAYSRRGAAYALKGDLESAIKDCDQAIHISPRAAMAYYSRGLLRALKGDFKAAIEDFGKAIDLNPRLAIAFYNRGLSLEINGDFASAIDNYNEAIRINSQFTDAYFFRGRVYSNKGEFDKAIEDFKAVLQIDPDHKRAQTNLKMALLDKVASSFKE